MIYAAVITIIKSYNLSNEPSTFYFIHSFTINMNKQCTIFDVVTLEQMKASTALVYGLIMWECSA